MRKLFNSYRDAVTPAAAIAAKTHSVDFANVGVVTHLIISWVQTYTSGTSTASMLGNTYVDLSLEGFGKIVDNLSMRQLAGVTDIESGAVLYRESTTALGPICHMAIPIGKIDLWDDVMKLRIAVPAQAGTMASATMSCSLACLADGFEMGMYLYERQTLDFGAANQRLEKDFRAYGYDRIYLDNNSGVLSQFEVTPKNGTPSYGYVEAIETFTYCCTRQEFFGYNTITQAPTSWNKMLLAYDSQGWEAEGAQVKVAVIASGDGDIDLVSRRRIYRPATIVKSKGAYVRKTQEQVMITKQLNPQAIIAKRALVTKANQSQGHIRKV